MGRVLRRCISGGAQWKRALQLPQPYPPTARAAPTPRAHGTARPGGPLGGERVQRFLSRRLARSLASAEAALRTT